MTKNILLTEIKRKEMDEQDIEILRALHTSTDWLNANEIKRSGGNLPEEYIVEQKLFFLKDQGLVEINAEKRARLTFKGNNLFWNPKLETTDKMLQLLKFSPYNTEEIGKILGLPSKEIENALTRLVVLKLIDIRSREKDSTEPFLISLSHNGKTRLKAEEPTPAPTSQAVTPDDTRKIIISTEEKLRDLVHSVMTREYGTNWEEDPTKSWKKEKQTQLKNRMEDTKKEFPTKQLPNRLIDYSYIMDLKTVISKNEKIFKPIFQPWNELMGLFDILGKYRNPEMHSTTLLQDHERKLCEGICGRFNEIVEHWKKGYLRKTQSYSCDYLFDVLESNDADAANKKALAEANSWLDNIKQQSLGVIGNEDIPGRGEALIIKFKEGTAKLTIPKTTRQYYGEEYSQSGRIHVVSEKFDVLDKIISVGNRKYWCLTWIVDGLNVSKVVSRVFELEGKTPPTNEGSFQRYIMSDGNLRIRVDLQQGQSNLTTINLVFDGGEIGKGFLKAHEIFSPDIILSIFYHEIQPIEVRKLVEESINV